jgi:hypothetical protein
MRLGLERRLRLAQVELEQKSLAGRYRPLGDDPKAERSTVSGSKRSAADPSGPSLVQATGKRIIMRKDWRRFESTPALSAAFHGLRNPHRRHRRVAASGPPTATLARAVTRW